MPVIYSIIIPAFNEGSRIGISLQKALTFVREQGWHAEIIVVNDGSSDDTADLVRSLMVHAPELRLLENAENCGKGYSVRRGMLNAHGDILLFSDADFSYPIGEFKKLIAAIAAGADLAIGSRWLNAEMQTKRQSLMRQLMGRTYNALLRVLLDLSFKDTQCGFKACTSDAAEVIFTRQQIDGWGFDAELLFIARHFGLKTTEVAVKCADDNRSNINPLIDGFKMFGELLTVRIHSLTRRYERPTFQASPSISQSLVANAKDLS